jgi:hypothetical protein
MNLFGGQGDEGKPKQITGLHVLAAQALSEGKTAAEAAVIANVHERTVENWKKETWFRRLQSDFVSSVVAAAKLGLDETTILSKRNRLIEMQGLSDMVKAKLSRAEKPTEVVALAKVHLDVLQAVSKEIGEEGQPLHAKSEKSGLPYVINLDAPGVLKEDPPSPGATADKEEADGSP